MHIDCDNIYKQIELDGQQLSWSNMAHITIDMARAQCEKWIKTKKFHLANRYLTYKLQEKRKWPEYQVSDILRLDYSIFAAEQVAYLMDDDISNEIIKGAKWLLKGKDEAIAACAVWTLGLHAVKKADDNNKEQCNAAMSLCSIVVSPYATAHYAYLAKPDCVTASNIINHGLELLEAQDKE